MDKEREAYRQAIQQYLVTENVSASYARQNLQLLVGATLATAGDRAMCRKAVEQADAALDLLCEDLRRRWQAMLDRRHTSAGERIEAFMGESARAPGCREKIESLRAILSSTKDGDTDA